MGGIENDAGCPNAETKSALVTDTDDRENGDRLKGAIVGRLGALGMIEDSEGRLSLGNAGMVSFGNTGAFMGFIARLCGSAEICGMDNVLMAAFWDAQADENCCSWDFTPAPRLSYDAATMLARALNSWVYAATDPCAIGWGGDAQADGLTTAMGIHAAAMINDAFKVSDRFMSRVWPPYFHHG
jgi:hypothetical protein